MHFTVNILAFWIILCAVILIHLIIAIKYSKLDCAPHVILPGALRVITAEEPLRFTAVSAPFLIFSTFCLLQFDLTCYNLLLIINEPDIN
jgi:hypothetical protein